jgi:hypothetical protein
MLELENIYVDNIDDELGVLLNKIQSIPTWTKEKYLIAEDITKQTKKRKYSVGMGARSHYHLYGGTGSSLIYQVPSMKRGYLAQYRGKLVRIFSLGSSRYKVHFGIQELSNEVVNKLKLIPKFPG